MRSEAACALAGTARIGRGELASVLAIVLLSALLRTGIASIPLERDEGEYAYIAQRWLAGDVPYRDAFDQKPPVVFLAYAALFAVGAKSTAAIHWLAHAAVVCAALCVYSVGRRLFSHVAGAAAALGVVVLSMDASLFGQSANTEVFAMAALSVGTCTALRAGGSGRVGAALLAGVCGGLALGCKQVSLPVVAFQGLCLVVARMRPGGKSAAACGGATRPGGLGSAVGLAGAFTAGILLVVLPVCAYFAAQGAWAEFYDCVVGHNVAYSAQVPLRSYAANFLFAAKRIAPSLWPLLLAAAFGAYAGARERSPRVGLCCAWALASLAAVSIGGFFREHYFQLLVPPVALLAGVGIERAARIARIEQLGARIERRTVIATALALAAAAWPVVWHRDYYLAGEPERVVRELYDPNPFAESVAIGRVLREVSQPDETIFVYGSEPQILFYAERVSASRYIFAYPLYADDPRAKDRQLEVIEELRRRRPEFVVASRVLTSFLPARNAPAILDAELERLLAESYEPFAEALAASDGSYRVVRADQGSSTAAPPGSDEATTLAVWRRRE